MLVLIEGNISASKSTVVQSLNGVRFPEPLEHENPFLERFYSNASRYATDMQIWTLTYRYNQWKQAQAMNFLNRDELYLLDRSLFLDYAFCKVNHDLGAIEDCEYELYRMLHETMQEQIYFPDFCLWLRVRPEICLERAKARARGCECGLTLGYLQRLEEAYCECMATLARKCPVVEIDGEQDRDAVKHDCELAIEKRRTELNSAFPRWCGGY
jgi:deoxyadenosine/deoxycytidine kinase